MKKHILLTAAFASLALAGCDDPAPTQPAPDGEVVIVDDCPEGNSTTGEPCK